MCGSCGCGPGRGSDAFTAPCFSCLTLLRTLSKCIQRVEHMEMRMTQPAEFLGDPMGKWLE